MPRLEPLAVPAECRTTKDWFPTRESAEDVVLAILAHIKMTGQTHTCFCHTHTKPPVDAVPVYLAKFDIPERFRKEKRFCPCPVCWDNYPKFGCGKIAWFPDERVIRLIGDHCFASLNPEGHEQAQTLFEREQARRRLTNFLLANVGRVPDVIAIVERALVVAEAVEEFHGLLHNRLKMAEHSLWRHVRHDGELRVFITTQEFRRSDTGDMYTRDVETMQVFAVLDGYQMLDPTPLRLSDSLTRALNRIRPYSFDDWEAAVGQMNDDDKKTAADNLNRGVRTAKDKIAEIEVLIRLSERVAVNTLRSWGAHQGCPAPFFYSHDGRTIRFGRSDTQTVGFALPENFRDHIEQIDFWTEPERRR